MGSSQHMCNVEILILHLQQALAGLVDVHVHHAAAAAAADYQ